MAEGSENLLNDFDKSRIREAFKAEFDSRGLTYKEEGGDMEVSLYLVLDQKTSVSSYTDYHGTQGYGYRRYGGWGTGHASTTYNEYDNVQGTLVMDVFDAGSKELVWQAIAAGGATPFYFHASTMFQELPRSSGLRFFVGNRSLSRPFLG